MSLASLGCLGCSGLVVGLAALPLLPDNFNFWGPLRVWDFRGEGCFWFRGCKEVRQFLLLIGEKGVVKCPVYCSLIDDWFRYLQADFDARRDGLRAHLSAWARMGSHGVVQTYVLVGLPYRCPLEGRESERGVGYGKERREKRGKGREWWRIAMERWLKGEGARRVYVQVGGDEKQACRLMG